MCVNDEKTWQSGVARTEKKRRRKKSSEKIQCADWLMHLRDGWLLVYHSCTENLAQEKRLLSDLRKKNLEAYEVEVKLLILSCPVPSCSLLNCLPARSDRLYSLSGGTIQAEASRHIG